MPLLSPQRCGEYCYVEVYDECFHPTSRECTGAGPPEQYVPSFNPGEEENYFLPRPVVPSSIDTVDENEMTEEPSASPTATEESASASRISDSSVHTKEPTEKSVSFSENGVRSDQDIEFRNAKAYTWMTSIEDDVNFQEQFCDAMKDHMLDTIYLSSMYTIDDVTCYGFSFEPNESVRRSLLRRVLLEESQRGTFKTTVATTARYSFTNYDEYMSGQDRFGRLIEDSINRDDGDHVKERLEDNDIFALSDTEVFATETVAPLSVNPVPVKEHEFTNSEFASTALGMSLILSLSAIALIFAGVLFYKGMQRSREDPGEGEGKNYQLEEQLAVVDLTDAFRSEARRNLFDERGDTHSTTVSSSSQGYQSKIEYDLEEGGHVNRTNIASTAIVPYERNARNRNSRPHGPQERERIMRGKITRIEMIPPYERNAWNRNYQPFGPQERERIMRANTPTEMVPYQRNARNRKSQSYDHQERERIMHAKVRSSEVVQRGRNTGKGNYQPLGHQESIMHAKARSSQRERNTGKRNSRPLDHQESIMHAKIRSSEAVQRERNTGKRNSQPLDPQESVMHAKIRSSEAVQRERNTGKRNCQPLDPQESIMHTKIRSSEAVQRERNTGKRNSQPFDHQESIMHAKIRSSEAVQRERNTGSRNCQPFDPKEREMIMHTKVRSMEATPFEKNAGKRNSQPSDPIERIVHAKVSSLSVHDRPSKKQAGKSLSFEEQWKLKTSQGDRTLANSKKKTFEENTASGKAASKLKASQAFSARLKLNASQGDMISKRSMVVDENTARRKKTAPKSKANRGDLMASAPTSLSVDDSFR